MGVKLDQLRRGDIGSAYELSAAQEWNQTAANWQRLIALEPSGCFAARRGDRLIGTVTTTTYGQSLAWIGMMIVDPHFRRQGIGAALMRHALDYLDGLGVASVKLDATPAGRPLYESLGFSVDTELERWQGVANPGAISDLQGSDNEPLKPLLELDRAAYNADRSRMLNALVAESMGGPLVVRSEDGSPEGYALARQGRTATYIGPVIGTTATASASLVEGMLARCAGEEVCLDVHRGGLVEPSLLEKRGLSKRRNFTRMCLGEDTGAGTTRSIGASAGPEFG